MQEKNVSRKQRIYDLMSGAFDLEKCNVTESVFVENEFMENKTCGNLYEQVYEAKIRLSEKLGVDEDVDVEIIINNLLTIAEKLSMKMYDYATYKSMYVIWKQE